MNPARFKRRIELLQRTLSTDDLLQSIEVYQSWGNLWADIKTVRGQEAIQANQERQNKITRFIVRYSRTFDRLLISDTTSFEIRFKGVTYDVKDFINDDELNKTVTILAEGRV